VKVSRVAFDEFSCSNGIYRFGSVGEDALMMFWQFNEASLEKPPPRKYSFGVESTIDIAGSVDMENESGKVQQEEELLDKEPTLELYDSYAASTYKI
jgi:hypothetical protein